MSDKRIKSALISVFHKEGLDLIVQRLDELGVKIYSTGGTHKFISELGVEAVSVESLTSYPSILGGRVKTLHPKVFGGILTRREHKEDVADSEKYEIPEIDLVIVDLYPFSDTVKSGATLNEIIEKIDIGGISLIRAAAKNYNDVLTVADSTLYKSLLSLLNDKEGLTSIGERRRFALEAFRVSSGYDTDIFNFFNSEGDSGSLRVARDTGHSLRYGENPHQKARYYGDLNDIFTQLHGKEVSYNNLLDIEAALSFIAGIEEPAFAIIKHNNACGLATDANLTDAWKKALSGDPVSAFGGVIATNRSLDGQTAAEMAKLFFEVVIAPGYDAEALDILKRKKRLIILEKSEFTAPGDQWRSLFNGVLWQERDMVKTTTEEAGVVTEREPDSRELKDMELANSIVMNTKSNAIVLVREGKLIGSGTGQTSRVDAVRHAIGKAVACGNDTGGAVMASDAFFPFPDSVLLAAEAGITAVIQPGGSVKDSESVKACNRNGLAMVMTGVRHFKH